MASMSVQRRRHHLPAAHIGYFSPMATPDKLRKRPVCVLVKEQNRTFWASAESVGYSKGIYGYGKFMDWDAYFKGGEVHIHQAVDNLMRLGPDRFRLNDWIRLAWYITTLIARGPDLEYEIEKTFRERGASPYDVTPGYVTNAQRIGSAVIRARWDFIWSTNGDFVISDRGVTGLFKPEWHSWAYFIPLRKTFGVMLGSGPHLKRVRWSGTEWCIEISHSGRQAPDVLNRWTWHASRIQTYGPDSDQLLSLREVAVTLPEELRHIAQRYEGANLLGGTVKDRMKDELLLLTLLAGQPPPGASEATEFSI